MKAAVFHGSGQPMTIEDVVIHKPSRNEVLVRTVASGLCHSDLHFIDGMYPAPLPAVLGHEAAGVVEAVGEGVTYLKPGDHVISCLSVFCGECEFCLSGHLTVCQDTQVRQPYGAAKRMTWKGEHLNQMFNLSAFAEQILVHEHALVKVRDDMPLDLACLIGCGVVTGYGAVTRTARIAPGAKVAVFGCGGVGLSAINAAQIAGAGRIIAVDRDPGKEAMAKLFGATDFVDASQGTTVEQIQILTGGGVDHALECVGIKQTAEQAFASLRARGVATLIGMPPLGMKLELTAFDFVREKRIQGSSMGSNQFRTDMPLLVDFYMQGRLHLKDMVSNRIHLNEINESFAALKKGGLARNVIVFE